MKRLKSNLTVLADVIAALKFLAVAVVISVGWLLFLLLEPLLLFDALRKFGKSF